MIVGAEDVLAAHKLALSANNRKESLIKDLIQTVKEHNIPIDDEFREFMGDSFNEDLYNVYLTSSVPTNPECEVIEPTTLQTPSKIIANVLKQGDDMVAEMERSNSLKPLQDLTMRALTRAANVKDHLIKEMARNVNGAPTAFEIGGITKLSESLHKDVELLKKLNAVNGEADGGSDEFFDDTHYSDRSVI